MGLNNDQYGNGLFVFFYLLTWFMGAALYATDKVEGTFLAYFPFFSQYYLVKYFVIQFL